MAILDSVLIDHHEADERYLILKSGDLQDVTDVDYLLISSRPRDYDHTQGGWVEALHDAGISVAELASNPEMDLRSTVDSFAPTLSMPCWVSRPILGTPGFKRLLVFEPDNPAVNAPTAVWTAFQTLHVFAGADVGSDSSARVALPVLSSEAGEADFSVMLRMIFFAAVSLAAKGKWASIEIIVPEGVSDSAQREFAAYKTGYLAPPEYPESVKEWVSELCAQYPSPDVYRMSGKAEGSKLTERQFKAVYAYTMSSYIYLNRALRKNDVTDLEYIHMQPLMEALGTALAKLDNHLQSPVLGRIIRHFDGIENIYKDQSLVLVAAYSSTSKLLVTPVGIPRGGHVLRLAGDIEKYIREISFYPGEEEVLFDSGMSHLIVDVERVEQADNSYFFVTTRQVLPNSHGIQFSHL